ncbi:MAG: hypothetical protein N3A69_14840, partial [Leptospiraceae bacterium]|nr:hypothetical protein [Leptospiraceae bacterium]
MRKTEEFQFTSEAIEQYEKKIFDQRQLIEISKALNSHLDYKNLIDALLNICLAQLQTMKAALFVAPDIDANHFMLDPSHRGFDISDKEMHFSKNFFFAHLGQAERFTLENKFYLMNKEFIQKSQ